MTQLLGAVFLIEWALLVLGLVVLVAMIWLFGDAADDLPTVLSKAKKPDEDA